MNNNNYVGDNVLTELNTEMIQKGSKHSFLTKIVTI